MQPIQWLCTPYRPEHQTCLEHLLAAQNTRSVRKAEKGNLFPSKNKSDHTERERQAWSTLQSSEHQKQEQFLSPSNPSHEHLILNIEHTTLLYNYLFTTYTFFFFFFLNVYMSDLTHNCLYCILCFCHFVHCLFVYLYIVILLSMSCPVAVILLHCEASVTITNSLYV